MTNSNKKKTRLYLIRHGETDWNVLGKYQGSTDIELSETGLNQAKLLGKRFEKMELDKVYSSPLKRAMATAQTVADAKNLPVILEEAFQEINFGDWEGKTTAEIEAEYSDMFKAFVKNPVNSPIPGEGSFKNAMDRGVTGIKKVLADCENENVAIISHGALIRVIMMGLLELEESFYRKTWLYNTAISIVDIYEDGKVMLITLNDKAHLDLIDL